jgi:hypothetical protein
VDGHAVLVGDAASFIEPLSSAGVKKALTSAWRTAVLVNTCLSKPHMLGPASDFHTRREQDVYDECLRRSTAFFQTAAAVHDDPFWSARLPQVRLKPDPTNGGEPDTTSGLLDEALRHAWASLRDTPMLDVRPAPDLRFHRIAVIEDREIVLRDGVAVPGFDEPVRFWKGVNLPELIRIAAGCRDVASVIETYHRSVAVIDPRSLLLGLSLVTSCRLMVPSPHRQR